MRNIKEIGERQLMPKKKVEKKTIKASSCGIYNVFFFKIVKKTPKKHLFLMLKPLRSQHHIKQNSIQKIIALLKRD